MMPRISKIPNRILEIIDISERNQQFKSSPANTVYTVRAQQESNLINAMKEVTT